MVYYVFRFLNIWAWFAIITILFSILIMCFSFHIFEKANKNFKHSFIPIYNLLILLDIVEMSRLYFILLLFPVANVLVIYLILYRLSIVFHTSTSFALGLIFLGIIFIPILNFSKYGIEVEEEKQYDNVTDSMMSLLTEKEYNELNNIVDDTPKVDNVFKAKIKEIPEAPTFRANKIKYKEMIMEEEPVEEVKKVEPIQVQEIYSNRFINTKVTEEDDSIEIVEL